MFNIYLSTYYLKVDGDTSLVVQWLRRHLTMQETQIRFLGQEDPLEKGMAVYSILAWKIPWTEEPGKLQSMGSQQSDMT